MQIETISDLRKAFRIGPYAWPGGYPMYFLMIDGEPLSWEAAKKEKRHLIEAIANDCHDGWRPIAIEINWEDELYCAHTGKRIEAAYND